MTDSTQDASAPGSGSVVTPNANETLNAKLAQVARQQAGTEPLADDLAAAVTAHLSDGNISALSKSVVQSTLDFMRDLGPTCNVDPKDGARRNVVYYRDLQNYINNAPNDFRKGFGMLLRIIADQRKAGVFSQRFLFRFVPFMAMAAKDRRGLEYLFSALADLAPASGRAQALRQVDLNKVGEFSLNGEGAQRLVGYFNI